MTATATRRAPDLVILLSIDGLGASYIDDPALELPALRGLAARGTRARRMRVIFPSVTWPCHTSLVTGVSPARHGILGNMVFDRHGGEPLEHFGDRNEVPIAAETLWDRLRARGERTASICWPKTRGVAAIPDNIPEFYEQELFERYASRPLWTELAQAGCPSIATAPGARPTRWARCRTGSPWRRRATCWPRGHRGCSLLHFLTLDSFQHDYGIGTPEARWALREMDALVGRLLDSLAALGRLESTTLLVFGDHGFARVDTRHHLNQMVRELGLLELDAGGAPTKRHAWVAGNGGAAYVYALDGAPTTAVARMRERFGALPGVEVIGPEQYPALGLPAPAPGSHVPDLILAADDGVFFTGHATPEAAAAAPVYMAAHGHRPELAPLGAAFLMAGPGVRAGTALGEIGLLSVAPTVARLLGIELPAAETAPLDEALVLA